MESPPSSKIRFLDKDGKPIDGPSEWAEAHIEILSDSSVWEEVRLLRNGDELDVRLSRANGQRRLIAEWSRSGIGQYDLQLQLPGCTETRRVIVLPERISLASYAHLLDDLTSRLPAAVALGLQRTGALAGVALRSPEDTMPAQELLRLRRAVMGYDRRLGLVELLPRLGRAPHYGLAETTKWSPRDRARRPDPAGLIHVMLHPHNLDAQNLPRYLQDVQVEQNVDVHENQLVAFYVHLVALRLRRLWHVLHKRELSEPAMTLIGDIDDLMMRLAHAQRTAAFLNDVSLPTSIPAHTTMVLLRNPLYRAALEGYLELNRSLAVALDEPALAAPLENVPRLYQIWGTLKVLNSLLEVASACGYRVRSSGLIRREADGMYIRILPNGLPALVLEHPLHDTTISCIPERSYHRRSRLRSISHEQRPDLSIEVQSPNSRGELYLFDPKYKSDPRGKPLKVDIDRMHAYRDAIRDEHGQHVVRFAAILFPGNDNIFSSDLMALSAIPGSPYSLDEHLAQILKDALR